MSRSKLALLGGNKTIKHKFFPYNSIGEDEVEAAKSVVESGVLSSFLGSWGEGFHGGPKVKEFEKICEDYFEVKHAISVNSWTSGLIASVGAIDIEPGDEIIVSPWTMCASATSILHWNAIPVFADIERDTFCLDPASVESNISSQTKAIMTIDIFGHSSNINELKKIAEKYNLKLICDSAQSPGTIYNGRKTGTISDVGGFSLNYHKHIHTGEGGIIVTNNDYIAQKLRLIRNHAEAVVQDMGNINLINMIGYNFRLGEIESAIGIEQLKKLDNLVAGRQKIAEKITSGINELAGLRVPIVKSGCSHGYYIYPLILDCDILEVSRDTIISALESEGVEGIIAGYQNIHLLPIFQEKIAYGSKGFPWNSPICRRDISYRKGICPLAEELHEKSFIGIEMCLHKMNDEEIYLLIEAFRKVWSNMDELKEYDNKMEIAKC